LKAANHYDKQIAKIRLRPLQAESLCSDN